MLPTLLNGFILGWSVAWPPGPVNAEIIRRGLLPREQGGGFWATWRIGLGACTGDFIWALTVTAGAGPFLNRPAVRLLLGTVSLILLAILAITFAGSAWKTFHDQKNQEEENLSGSKAPGSTRARRSYLLGLMFTLSSPWNIGFWLAVVGSQQSMAGPRTFLDSLTLAGAVVMGALVWTIVLCTAVRSGARIFARPVWQGWTQLLTAVVMIYFALKLARQIFA